MPKSFRDLKVWHRSIDLTLAMYQLTSDFPKQETYELMSQMRRAAVSIASDVAEGSARTTKKDFRQFVAIARGSTYELQTQLFIAKRLRYSSVEKIGIAGAISHEVGQMLTGLSTYLKRQNAQAGSTEN